MGSIKILIQQDEDNGVVREFSSNLSKDSSWTKVLEEMIWLLKGMTYTLPETDELMEAIEKVAEKSAEEIMAKPKPSIHLWDHIREMKMKFPWNWVDRRIPIEEMKRGDICWIEDPFLKVVDLDGTRYSKIRTFQADELGINWQSYPQTVGEHIFGVD